MKVPKTNGSRAILAIACGGILWAQPLQRPKPSPAELEQAKAIAALPAADTPAAINALETAQATPGLVQAVVSITEAETRAGEKERLARLAIDLARHGSHLEMEGIGYFVLATALNNQADYLGAVENFALSIDRYQRGGSPPVRISGAFANRAVGRLHLADLNGAMDDAQQAMDLVRDSPDPVPRARVLNTMGNVYKVLGDFRQSLAAYHSALQIARDRNEKMGESFLLNNISSLYLEQGNYNLAIDYGRRSLQLKESLGKTKDSISSLGNLATACDRAGLRAEAREHIEKAIRLAREIGDKTQLGQSLRTAVSIDMDHALYAGAIARLEEARAAFRDTGERLDQAGALADIARAHFAQQQYEQTVDAALEAAGLARQLAGLLVLEDATLTLGRAYHALGKTAEARAALAESIAAVEEIRENVGGAESERESYLAGHTDAYRELLAIEMDEHRSEQAFRLAEQAKGRVLLDLLRGGRPQFDRVLSAAERQQEIILRGRLVSLRAQRTAAAEASDPAASARVRDLDREIHDARVALSDYRSNLYVAHPELRAARGDVLPISLAQAGQLLAGRAGALLEYVVTPQRTYLFVITGGPAGPLLRTHVLPVTAQTLESEVARFRDQIASRDPGFAEVARKLYARLLGPAARELAGKHALVVIPDGELWRLPFQALQTAAGRFLAEDAAVSYAPSLSVMHALRESRPSALPGSRSLLVLADPTGDIPEAHREAQGIAALYGASNSRVLRGAAATIDVFRSHAGSHDVLHVAAHGVFDDRNPMSSHIVLAADPKRAGDDGWMEAGEVRSMQLKAALVVLSGCETARGHFENGEGAVGLSWAFLAAGARAVVASEWRVESSSTSSLMVAFHQALLAGAGTAEALQSASVQLLATEKFHHPFYWAGFVVLGAR